MHADIGDNDSTRDGSHYHQGRCDQEEQDAGSGTRTQGTQSDPDICFTNFLQIILTHLDMDRFRFDQTDD